MTKYYGLVGGTTEVPAKLSLDLIALEKYMVNNVPGHCGPITIKKFSSGQSNPTYKIESPGGAFVLRKQPPGKNDKRAHRVDREYLIIKSLRDSCVPVPEVVCLCQDHSVLGGDFFIMKFVTGRIWGSPSLVWCSV